MLRRYSVLFWEYVNLKAYASLNNYNIQNTVNIFKMGADCSSCSVNDLFNPDHYVQLPNVTREDVLQLRSAFLFFEPWGGHIHLDRLPPNHNNDLLKSFFKGYREVSFDDFYRVMKPKLVERKAKLQEESIDFENAMVNVGCFFWPTKEGEDLDVSGSDTFLSLLRSKSN